MKLMKKLSVFVAAMAMVLSLVACGGSDFPKTYEVAEPRGEGEQKMTLVLNEDNTYEFTFYATESNGSGNKVMDMTMTGTYTLTEDVATLDTAEGAGYYMAGASKTDFTFTKDEPGMYVNTPTLGSFELVLAEDGTFYPAE